MSSTQDLHRDYAGSEKTNKTESFGRSHSRAVPSDVPDNGENAMNTQDSPADPDQNGDNLPSPKHDIQELVLQKISLKH